MAKERYLSPQITILTLRPQTLLGSSSIRIVHLDSSIEDYEDEGEL